MDCQVNRLPNIRHHGLRHCLTIEVLKREVLFQSGKMLPPLVGTGGDAIVVQQLSHLVFSQGTPLNYLETTQKSAISEAERNEALTWLGNVATRKMFDAQIYLEAVHKYDTLLGLVKVQPRHLRIICLHLAAQRHVSPSCLNSKSWVTSPVSSFPATTLPGCLLWWSRGWRLS